MQVHGYCLASLFSLLLHFTVRMVRILVLHNCVSILTGLSLSADDVRELGGACQRVNVASALRSLAADRDLCLVCDANWWGSREEKEEGEKDDKCDAILVSTRGGRATVIDLSTGRSKFPAPETCKVRG